MTAAMTDHMPVYPLPPADGDPRFSLGLVIDVGEVLVTHGFPPPAGEDLVELQQALFRFLYAARP